METYFNVAQIILSVSLIAIVLLQTRGGGLGGIFGSQSGVYRTRRGIEKTLFNMTIAIVAAFLVISLLRLNM
jgi:preprotein translocase subunit SecG